MIFWVHWVNVRAYAILAKLMWILEPNKFKHTIFVCWVHIKSCVYHLKLVTLMSCGLICLPQQAAYCSSTPLHTLYLYMWKFICPWTLANISHQGYVIPMWIFLDSLRHTTIVNLSRLPNFYWIWMKIWPFFFFPFLYFIHVSPLLNYHVKSFCS